MRRKPTYIILCILTHLSVVCQDSTNKKIGNYIKLNIELGAVANNPFCNVPKMTTEQSHFENTYYHDVSSAVLKYGLTGGVNAIFGHKKVKAFLGISYLQSNCEFDFHYGSTTIAPGGSYIASSEKFDIHYKGIIHYLNTSTGMRFYFKKGFRLEITTSVNIPFYYSTRATGTSEFNETKRITDSTFIHSNEQNNYHGTIQHENLTFNTFSISLKPKLIYSLYNYGKPFEFFVSRNLSLTDRTPWWVIGVNYYPFKKLR